MFCRTAVLRIDRKEFCLSLIRSLTPQQATGNALTVAVQNTPSVIALDGERELCVAKGEHLSVSMNPMGPYLGFQDSRIPGFQGSRIRVR